MHENIINEITNKFQGKTLEFEDILNELFENKELKEKYSNENRRSTIIGELANKILIELNIDKSCKIMAIGDIKYFDGYKVKWQELVKKSISNIDLDKLSLYDLTSQGSQNLRERLFEYINLYYQIPSFKDKIINEIIPTYGSTDGFVMVLDMLRQKYEKLNFIYPEASFLASAKIAETYNFDLIPIKKPSKNNFFISKEQIDEIYKNNNKQNIFYFTSVGNPTGEKVSEIDLNLIIEYIVSIDNNAIILLDNVYVGLLKNEISTSMFKKIFSNEKILKRIIFLESLSKTLGTTGIRIGFLWTLNESLSLDLKKNIILKKAGFSKLLDETIVKLLSDLEEITKFQKSVYDFISSQRINFLSFIKKDFKEFFDFENSSNVIEREGIYVLLKVKEGFSVQQIFAKTGIIGVEVILSDGKYIRYSFGNTNYF